MRRVEKRKFSCFYDTQLPTVCRLPFAVNVMLNLSINTQSFTIIDILFAMFNIGDDFIILNHLILTAKFYIYRCKFNGVRPIL